MLKTIPLDKLLNKKGVTSIKTATDKDLKELGLKRVGLNLFKGEGLAIKEGSCAILNPETIIRVNVSEVSIYKFAKKEAKKDVKPTSKTNK